MKMIAVENERTVAHIAKIISTVIVSTAHPSPI